MTSPGNDWQSRLPPGLVLSAAWEAPDEDAMPFVDAVRSLDDHCYIELELFSPQEGRMAIVMQVVRSVELPWREVGDTAAEEADLQLLGRIMIPTVTDIAALDVLLGQSALLASLPAWLDTPEGVEFLLAAMPITPLGLLPWLQNTESRAEAMRRQAFAPTEEGLSP